MPAAAVIPARQRNTIFVAVKKLVVECLPRWSGRGREPARWAAWACSRQGVVLSGAAPSGARVTVTKTERS